MTGVRPVVALNSNDAELYLVLQHILAAEGYELHLIGGIEEWDRLLEVENIHAVILDCASDSCGCADICSRLKNGMPARRIPVAALISSGGSAQHIQLIKAGIDEGLIRPLMPSRLLQFLQRQSNADGSLNELGTLVKTKSLQQHILEMDAESKRVRCNGHQIELPPIGFRLWECLLKSPGRVRSREALMTAGWRDTVRVNQRSVDIHIVRLRRSLRSISGFDMIRTVHSVGYMLQNCSAGGH